MSKEREAGARIEVGDYLVASWGYDQTNADFFKVTKRTPKMATFVQVEGQRHGDTSRLEPSDTPHREHSYNACELPMPQPDDAGNTRNDWRDYHAGDVACMIPVTYRRKVQDLGKDGEGISIESYKWARLYEGDGAFDTSASGQPGH